jgi:hypothetical protein
MLLLRVIALGHLAAALVTLQTIREITNCTKDCTAEIIGAGIAQLGKEVGIGQVPILELRNDEDDDEMEDVSISDFGSLFSGTGRGGESINGTEETGRDGTGSSVVRMG